METELLIRDYFTALVIPELTSILRKPSQPSSQGKLTKLSGVQSSLFPNIVSRKLESESSDKIVQTVGEMNSKHVSFSEFDWLYEENVCCGLCRKRPGSKFNSKCKSELSLTENSSNFRRNRSFLHRQKVSSGVLSKPDDQYFNRETISDINKELKNKVSPEKIEPFNISIPLDEQCVRKVESSDLKRAQSFHFVPKSLEALPTVVSQKDYEANCNSLTCPKMEINVMRIPENRSFDRNIRPVNVLRPPNGQCLRKVESPDLRRAQSFLHRPKSLEMLPKVVSQKDYEANRRSHTCPKMETKVMMRLPENRCLDRNNRPVNVSRPPNAQSLRKVEPAVLRRAQSFHFGPKSLGVLPEVAFLKDIEANRSSLTCPKMGNNAMRIPEMRGFDQNITSDSSESLKSKSSGSSILKRAKYLLRRPKSPETLSNIPKIKASRNKFEKNRSYVSNQKMEFNVMEKPKNQYFYRETRSNVDEKFYRETRSNVDKKLRIKISPEKIAPFNVSMPLDVYCVRNGKSADLRRVKSFNFGSKSLESLPKVASQKDYKANHGSLTCPKMEINVMRIPEKRCLDGNVRSDDIENLKTKSFGSSILKRAKYLLRRPKSPETFPGIPKLKASRNEFERNRGSVSNQKMDFNVVERPDNQNFGRNTNFDGVEKFRFETSREKKESLFVPRSPKEPCFENDKSALPRKTQTLYDRKQSPEIKSQKDSDKTQGQLHYHEAGIRVSRKPEKESYNRFIRSNSVRNLHSGSFSPVKCPDVLSSCVLCRKRNESKFISRPTEWTNGSFKSKHLSTLPVCQRTKSYHGRPSEIVYDSIIQNKHKTKTYWEQLMMAAEMGSQPPPLLKHHHHHHHHHNNSHTHTTNGVGGGVTGGGERDRECTINNNNNNNSEKAQSEISENDFYDAESHTSLDSAIDTTTQNGHDHHDHGLIENGLVGPKIVEKVAKKLLEAASLESKPSSLATKKTQEESVIEKEIKLQRERELALIREREAAAAVQKAVKTLGGGEQNILKGDSDEEWRRSRGSCKDEDPFNSIPTTDEGNYSEYGSEGKDDFSPETNNSRVMSPEVEMSGQIHQRTQSMDSMSSGHSSGSGSGLSGSHLDCSYVSINSRRSRGITVKPLDEPEEDNPSTFFRNERETPIEREIRLARDREEELRREKNNNVNNVIKTTESNNNKTVKSPKYSSRDSLNIEKELLIIKSEENIDVQSKVNQLNSLSQKCNSSGVSKKPQPLRLKKHLSKSVANLSCSKDLDSDLLVPSPLSPSLSPAPSPTTTTPTALNSNSHFKKFVATPATSQKKGLMKRFLESRGKLGSTFTLASPTLNSEPIKKLSTFNSSNSNQNTISVVNTSPRTHYVKKAQNKEENNCIGTRPGYKSAEEKIQSELMEMRRREEELRRQRAFSLARSQPNLLSLIDGEGENCLENEKEKEIEVLDRLPQMSKLRTALSNPNLLDLDDKPVQKKFQPKKKSALIAEWENRILKNTE